MSPPPQPASVSARATAVSRQFFMSRLVRQTRQDFRGRRQILEFHPQQQTASGLAGECLLVRRGRPARRREPARRRRAVPRARVQRRRAARRPASAARRRARRRRSGCAPSAGSRSAAAPDRAHSPAPGEMDLGRSAVPRLELPAWPRAGREACIGRVVEVDAEPLRDLDGRSSWRFSAATIISS